MSVFQLIENKIEFHFLRPQENQNHEFLKNQSQFYDFWFKNWDARFKATGNPKAGWEKYFYKVSLVSGLKHEGQVIAVLLFNFHHLKPDIKQKSDYFAYVEASVIDQLLERRLRKMVTVEYLCVDPECTKNTLQISLGKLIISMSAFITHHFNMDGLLSMPIGGTKVHEMLANIGAEVIQPEVKKYGYTLKLMMGKADQTMQSKDPYILKLGQTLWQKRILHEPQTDLTKIAA